MTCIYFTNKLVQSIARIISTTNDQILVQIGMNPARFTTRLHTKPPYQLTTDYQTQNGLEHSPLPPVANFLLVFFQGPIHLVRGRKLDKSIARSTTLAVLHDDYTIRRNRHPCHNQPTTQHSPVNHHEVHTNQHHHHPTNSLSRT